MLLKNDVMGSWLSVKLGWDTVGKCVLFGATGVIGSKDVEFFVVRKVEKRCATCALSGCREEGIAESSRRILLKNAVMVMGS
jgi:hypothetical protein